MSLAVLKTEPSNDYRGTLEKTSASHNAAPRSTPSLHDVTEAVALERIAPRRPGLAERLARRRSGLEGFQITDASLRPLLAPTFGLLIYDEQIVDLAIRVAAFSPDEAEAFRRDLPGLDVGGAPAALAGWRIRFVRGAVERGMELQRAEEIFLGLLSVSGGTVCRAECTEEAMRLLRDTLGFGVAREKRAAAVFPAGVTPLPQAKRQLVLPWLEPAEADAGAEAGAGTIAAGAVEEQPFRRRA